MCAGAALLFCRETPAEEQEAPIRKGSAPFSDLRALLPLVPDILHHCGDWYTLTFSG